MMFDLRKTLKGSPASDVSPCVHISPTYTGSSIESRNMPTVFCDRDGTIIENQTSYTTRLDQTGLLPGVAKALRSLNLAGWNVVLVTNQSAIGRNILSWERALSVHSRVLSNLKAEGVHVVASAICPHAPSMNCWCRKPKPGMLYEVAKKLNLNLEVSYMIGDAAEDIQAALAAGIRPILVKTGRGHSEEKKLKVAGLETQVAIVQDVIAAVSQIIMPERSN